MSYLDLPRIHFRGDFMAHVATGNNDAAFYALAGTPPASGLNWHVGGTNWFQLSSCTVTQVRGASGAVAGGDGLVGGAVETTGSPGLAKWADLDPDHQLSSQIWGAKIRVSLAAGGGHFEGTLRTCNLRDLWFSRVAGAGLAGAGGVFQSTLDSVTWDTRSTSPVFSALRAASPSRLSIKFVTYAYDTGTLNGKVVGTIGPFTAGEAEHVVVGRRLTGSGGSFGAAPYKLDTARNVIVLDLGNAIPESAVAGSRVSLGTLNCKLRRSAPPHTQLGPVDYSRAHYELTAGIEEVDVAAAASAASIPVATLMADLRARPIFLERTGPAAAVLEEMRNVIVASADATRLDPGATFAVEFFATQLAAADAGRLIKLVRVAGGATGLSFPATVTTNAAGKVTATFTASDPGTPRGSLDGEMFKVDFHLATGAADPPTPANRHGTIHIRVFSAFTLAGVKPFDPGGREPRWADVRAIFQQYHRLYPFMTGLVDMSSQATIKAYRDRQVAAGQTDRANLFMGLPETDPRYMPVTRDLSAAKKRLLLHWLSIGCPA